MWCGRNNGAGSGCGMAEVLEQEVDEVIAEVLEQEVGGVWIHCWNRRCVWLWLKYWKWVWRG